MNVINIKTILNSKRLFNKSLLLLLITSISFLLSACGSSSDNTDTTAILEEQRTNEILQNLADLDKESNSTEPKVNSVIFTNGSSATPSLPISTQTIQTAQTTILLQDTFTIENVYNNITQLTAQNSNDTNITFEATWNIYTVEILNSSDEPQESVLESRSYDGPDIINKQSDTHTLTTCTKSITTGEYVEYNCEFVNQFVTYYETVKFYENQEYELQLLEYKTDNSENAIRTVIQKMKI
jgi:hypothetical protein